MCIVFLYSLFIIQHSPGRVLNSSEVAYMNGKFFSICFYTFESYEILDWVSLIKFLLEKQKMCRGTKFEKH